ncbi:hypothetical protein Tco_0007349 [Tanacetum coccineum]
MLQNACLMFPEKLISWEKEEAGSPVTEFGWSHSHSLPDIQKECFANSVPLYSVGVNVQVVLKKKKGRIEVGKGRLGGLVALNDHEVDGDPQFKSQV